MNKTNLAALLLLACNLGTEASVYYASDVSSKLYLGEHQTVLAKGTESSC